ncbi:MAG: DMT family transporter [Desulfovibrio sp.]|jgi:drug/metabolite transporter (DMT)-like permease|nr:DMT family transporter [Desulfovibrio sp.]
MQISRRRAILLFTLVVVFWGLNWPVVKLLVQTIPPLWSAALRCIIAAAAVLVVQCVTGSFVIPKKRDISIILVIGVLNMTCGPAFMAAGLQFVPAGRSAVLGYTTPLWVAPGAWLFLGEALSPRRLLGVAAGLAGVFVLCNPFSVDAGSDTVLLGHGLLLLSAFSWAVAILRIRAHVWLSTPFQLLLWQSLLSSALLSALALIFEGPPSFSVSPRIALLLAYCGIPATALAYWAMTVINASLPAVTTSLGVLAAPVVGILGSAVMLGETVDARLIISACLILGGIALGAAMPGEQVSPRRRRSAAA